MNLIHIGLLQVSIATLPSYGVEQDEEAEDTQTGGAAPVDKWITKEEVLDNCDLLEVCYLYVRINLLTVVIPTAHTETNVKDWPLPE